MVAKMIGLEVITSDGVPTENGVPKGCLCVDKTNGGLYQNTGTSTTSTWTDIGSGVGAAVSSAEITDGEIVNADISASAAIAFSKLAALTSAQILVGNGSNVAAAVAMSGDATISNAGVITVTDVTVGGDAAGDLLYKSSATALTRLAKGTAGQMLLMDPGAANPTWTSMSGDVTMASGVTSTTKVAGAPKRTQATPTAKTVSATLTANEILAGIITVNQAGGATSAQQLPTVADLETALTGEATDDAFDFSVINTSTVDAEDASITTNTGWTLVGSMDIHAYSAAGSLNSSALFRARKTGADAWTLYRIA